MAGQSIYYYVHEGWLNGQFTVAIHRGDCIRCNHGNGQIASSFLRLGKWHGPYKRRSEAVAKLRSVPEIATRVTCECVQ